MQRLTPTSSKWSLNILCLEPSGLWTCRRKEKLLGVPTSYVWRIRGVLSLTAVIEELSFREVEICAFPKVSLVYLNTAFALLRMRGKNEARGWERTESRFSLR